jgi:membrane protein implicated in regulation of membrane protease activity
VVKEFAVYTAARFGIFFATFAAVLRLWILVVGTPDPILWPLLIAAVLSAVLSTYLLRGMRNRVTRRLQQRGEQAARRNAAVRAKDAEMRASCEDGA